MPSRSLNASLLKIPAINVRVELPVGFTVMLQFAWAAWPKTEGERRLRLPILLKNTERERMWEWRRQMATTGDPAGTRALAAYALRLSSSRASLAGLGFARVSGLAHLRAMRTEQQMCDYGSMSPQQLQQASMKCRSATMSELLIRHHFPVTTHTTAEQTRAAEFMDERSREIAELMLEVAQDHGVLEVPVGDAIDPTAQGRRPRRVAEDPRELAARKVFHDRMARVLRAAAKAEVRTEALHREALLRVIEAEAGDGKMIVASLPFTLDPLELRLLEMLLVGEPRGADNRTIVPPLQISDWFRSALELLGGFVKSPAELHVLPDLIEVAAGTDRRHSSVRKSVEIAIGFLVMSGTWLSDGRERIKEVRRLERGGNREVSIELIREEDLLRPAIGSSHDKDD